MPLTVNLWRLERFPHHPLAYHRGSTFEVLLRRRAAGLDLPGIEFVDGLVTPVYGDGRGTIVISNSRAGQRRTAAFWCDVSKRDPGCRGRGRAGRTVGWTPDGGMARTDRR